MIAGSSTFHPPLEDDAAYSPPDNRDAVATGTIRGAARGRARTSAFGQPPRSPSQPSSFRPDVARSSPLGERMMVRPVRTSDWFRPAQTGGSSGAVTFRNPEGNAGMRLERDPAAFLIRSNVALEVLTQLRDGRPQRPSEVRRALGGMHPQILRETVDHLGTLGLAHLRVLPGSKPAKVTRGVALPVVLQIARKGQAVLDHVDHYRELVRQDRALLPRATLERGLEA